MVIIDSFKVTCLIKNSFENVSLNSSYFQLKFSCLKNSYHLNEINNLSVKNNGNISVKNFNNYNKNYTFEVNKKILNNIQNISQNTYSNGGCQVQCILVNNKKVLTTGSNFTILPIGKYFFFKYFSLYYKLIVCLRNSKN